MATKLPQAQPQAGSTSTTKGVAWSDAELKALIGIWGDAEVQTQLDGAVRNKFVFIHIAKEMNKLGCNRDWEQCKTKIKNLKADYRNVKDNNGKTGRGRKSCKFYNELESILGHRPSSAPTVILDSGASTSNNTSQIDLCQEETQTNGIQLQVYSTTTFLSTVQT